MPEFSSTVLPVKMEIMIGGGARCIFMAVDLLAVATEWVDMWIRVR